MAVQLAKRLISVDEYHTMAEAGILTTDDRVELIHGEILEMSPIGSEHAAIVLKLNKLLNKIISDDLIIGVQSPVRINDVNELEPDVSILKPKTDYYTGNHPQGHDTLLIIEVSDSTYSYDKEVKLSLYASGGVPEYWIINLKADQIEVYTHPSNGRYKKMEIFDKSDSISLDFCKSEIRVDRLIS